MEFMRRTIVAFLLFFSVISSKAQDYEKLSKAFEASYAAENKGEYQQAIQALLTVYRADSYELNLRLGWLHYMSGRFTDALPYYQKSIDLMPVAIEAKLGYVLPAAALGNWAQVEKQYHEILKIDPMNTTANYRMGLIHYGRQEYAQALRFFEKVLNLYPFDYDTVIMVAWSHLKSGQMREAKVMFQKALLIRPNDTDALQGLGMIK
jgi:tetratricopeptide (TPR) repeat protein